MKTIIKLSTVFASLLTIGGCTIYSNDYRVVGYQEVITNSYVVAPSYIKESDGSVSPAASGTIYFGRIAPEPVYNYPYRGSIQPHIQPQVIIRK